MNINELDYRAEMEMERTIEEMTDEEYEQIVLGKTANKTATETPTETAINLDKITFLAIVGDRNTAKSNLMFYHAKNYKGKRPIYIMGYPKKVRGFFEVSNMQDLMNLRNCIVLIDEMQKFFKLYDRRANVELMEFLSVAAHTGVTIIGTTPLTQFITKGIEASVDVWNMTHIRDLGSLKNGSKPKRIVQNTKHYACTSYSLSLKPGEFLQYGDGLGVELNGIRTFPKMGVGKDWNA